MAQVLKENNILKVPILGKHSIHCGFHLTPYIASTVLSTLPSSTYVLITDTNVAKHHLKSFEAAFQQAPKPNPNSRFLSYVIPPGETSKSRQGKADIEDFLLGSRCTRDTVILALGGGVIGDLVGFVAATFMRGVRFVQIPTTLLAMVDSSVGGKTAIDTPHGKNLIGAFWQPEYIFIDAAFLGTLPQREFSNGMAEVIKTAAIWNQDEFASLESRSAEIFATIQAPSKPPTGNSVNEPLDDAQTLLLNLIVGSISVKSHIVTIDERETGLRNLVNFGHTIGHALEAVLTPKILHGECVGVGMVLEAEIARQLGHLGQVGVGRLTRCIKAYGLPVSVNDPRIASLPEAKGLTVDRLLDIMKIDKKNSGPDGKKVVLLSRIGKTLEEKATLVQDSVIKKILSEATVVVPAAGSTPAHNPVKMSTPGSKSISNRALVLAALAKGTCRLKNLLHSDDTQVMMSALLDLQGAKFSWEDGGETLVVEGGAGSLTVPPQGKELYLGNAGTAARFLTTVCTLVQSSSASASGENTIITGNARMKQRPIGPLVTALSANGSQIAYLESEGCLPLSIAPLGLKGGTIQLAASVSSQYVSSILLCAPYAREAITLELVGGQVISQPYIDMTIAMMATFGVHVTRRTDASGKLLDVYDIPQGVYVNPDVYAIESDASSATYPLAIAAITGSTCTIENIGSASLQGDAQFAVKVLERMGCEVVQSATETQVTGPKIGGLKGIDVDMEVMTDAFLTASVLGAVASGTTKITGIANQRVKECNRIQAMMDQLAKFGIQTKELDDGLEIYGRPLPELKTGCSVYCYDDHRVAMAFSVLGCVVPGSIIEEKRCVEKTWPNWWDDLENKIGFKVEGVELAHHAEQSHSGSDSASASTASIFVTGMRGSGKTFIGKTAASVLGWTFVDADHYMEETRSIHIRQFVKDNGWEEFRKLEVTILEELMKNHTEKCIISLGGGVVETPAARKLLTEYAKKGKPVVHIVRDMADIVSYLGEETARPAYGEPIEQVYQRREPWYRECSNFDFPNSFPAQSTLGELKQGTHNEVERFFSHITGQGVLPSHAQGQRSYFLALTFPDITPFLSQLEDIVTGVDAIELRVDLLKSPTDTEAATPSDAYVSSQLAAIRRVTSLPIVFTVRTVSQGGAFPDGAEKEAMQLIDLALRQGAEYIDVELSWSEASIAQLVKKKGASRIIASWHDWSGNMSWAGEEVKAKYDAAEKVGDIVKIVGKANNVGDNFALYDFVQRRSAPGSKPILAINMGSEGQLSRILNPTLTPVTHPLLPSKAAPGQLSFAQIQQALHLMGQLPAKQYYILGSPIAHSLSPTLHNTAFSLLGLPHVYSRFERGEVDASVKALLKTPTFGGASVTIPLKVDIIPLLDTLSPAAKAIGAVNTVIPTTTESGEVTLHGDNSDWIGMRDCIKAKLPGGKIKHSLVIGAGGTARAAIYALQQLGAQVIYLFNRTQSKAAALKDIFAGSGKSDIRLVDSIDSFPTGAAPSVIISTVPSTSSPELPGATESLAITSSLFSYQEGPAVVVDMAYKPKKTALLGLAESAGDRWSTVQGVEVLLEQGYVQFEKWTGRRCPRGAVSTEVWAAYEAHA